MKEVKIKTEFIKLQQLLKLADLVVQGSEAKIYISNGLVRVNGVITTERGKKVYVGDVVTFNGKEEIKVI